MKKLFLTTLTIFISLTIIHAQSKLKLTDKLSIYSSDANVSKYEESNSTQLNKDGIQVFNRSYQLLGPVHYLQCIGMEEDGQITIYDIECKPEDDKQEIVNYRDADTLFYIFDTLYHPFAARLVVTSETSAQLLQPVWVNDTMAYTVQEPGILNVVSVLMYPYNTTGMNFVFNENYQFSGKDTIYISAYDAIHNINWNPVDVNGDPLSTQGYVNNLFNVFYPLANGGYSIFGIVWFTDCIYKINDYQGVVPLMFGNISVNKESGQSNYLIEYPMQDSIVDDINLANDPMQLSFLNADYYFNEKRDTNVIYIGSTMKYVNHTGNPACLGALLPYYNYADTSWNTMLYLDLTDTEGFGYSMDFMINYLKYGQEIYYLDPPIMDQFGDLIGGTYYQDPEPDLHLFQDGDKAMFGKGYSYYWPRWQNNENYISCETVNMGMFGASFFGDVNTDSFRITDQSGNLVEEGAGLEIHSYGLAPGIYNIEQIRLLNSFDEYEGTSMLNSRLNTSLQDKSPPHLIRIYLLNDDNKLKYKFNTDEEVILKFTASDFNLYDNWFGGIGFQPIEDSKTKVSIKLHDEDVWIDVIYGELINDSITGTQYFAELSDYLAGDSAIYDLKIYIEDVSGNSSEQLLSPAFLYGDNIVGINEKPNYRTESEISIYPNPGRDVINIYDQNHISDTYKILNVNGNIVKAGRLGQNTYSSIDINDLAPGIYLIAFYKHQTPVLTEKIVKLL